MCFGNSNQEYDAVKDGQFGQWQAEYNRATALRRQIESGDLTGAALAKAKADFAKLNSVADTRYKTYLTRDPNAQFQAREVMRQGDIGLGQVYIDKAFKQFNPAYFDRYKSDYTGYYNPQLDQQYDTASGKLRAALRDRGIGQSTVGADAHGDLATEHVRARTNIGNEAQDAANKLRGTVEQAKTDLYGLNQQAADPKGANTRAVAQASAIIAPPQYSPLGQVFASALQPFANAAASYNNRAGSRYSTIYPGANSRGSGRVVV